MLWWNTSKQTSKLRERRHFLSVLPFLPSFLFPVVPAPSFLVLLVPPPPPSFLPPSNANIAVGPPALLPSSLPMNLSKCPRHHVNIDSHASCHGLAVMPSHQNNFQTIYINTHVLGIRKLGWEVRKLGWEVKELGLRRKEVKCWAIRCSGYPFRSNVSLGKMFPSRVNCFLVGFLLALQSKATIKTISLKKREAARPTRHKK